MYPAERQRKLVDLLAQKGFISIQDLADALSVSEITIRRDLNRLHRQGVVEKVVGGGQISKSAAEPTFMNKRVLQRAEKAAIASEVLTLIEPGMTIGLSAGTTTWTVAQKLKSNHHSLDDLTFVTNSTNVATVLKQNGWNDIHLTGGQFRTPSDALVGPLAEESARKLHTDLLCLGVHGIDAGFGLSTPNLQESAINRILMENTERVVLAFDHTKWGIRALAHQANLDEVDAIVTNETENSDADWDALRQTGIDLHLVHPQTED
ncbi:DeoR/GlpR family DNA-binding transcription regulator [Alicyclobacillus sp. SO9]|uniref:DeoR/GlpR family DNA-binding transcription regulator n=1 Tax=Alicyclobacillus sp. SO9 TaxID=2665646 RepID=UPI0018E6F0B3|nr:DeoR/GlpR family DNA-binding transcription regulator [Alicyclobacillus sp. SO9]QQE77938.1 DeoR/GlpR transcriptional regulator [Alicyclobacillus sp. SO9]